jgi:hypothetical protein
MVNRISHAILSLVYATLVLLAASEHVREHQHGESRQEAKNEACMADIPRTIADELNPSPVGHPESIHMSKKSPFC